MPVAPNTKMLRKAQIITAAVTVIATHGGDRARLKDVADEAGVSLGLVQHYFRTRQDLMEQTFRTVMGISMESWERVRSAAPDPLVALLAGIRLHVFGTLSFAPRWGFWAEFWALARREPSLTDLREQVYEAWLEPFETALERLRESGTINGTASPQEIAVILTALVDGLAIRSLMHPSALSEDASYDHILKSVGALLTVTDAELRNASKAAAELLSEGEIVAELTPSLVAEAMAADEV